MRDQTPPAGAMPVALDAMSSQSYPTGPVWAPYRLPIIGTGRTVDPRVIGVGFEGQAGGSESGQGGAGAAGSAGAAGDQGTGSAGSDGGAGSGSGKPATGEDQLGDAGKRAIQVERDARKLAEDNAKALQKQIDDLTAASRTETEKALDEAKAAGRSEVLELLHANVRSSAVEKALLSAGAMPSLVADLALAPEFASLKVGDDHKLDAAKVTAAVDKHKERVPDAYKAAAGEQGSSDGGARGGGRGPAKTLEEALERQYGGTA